MKNSCCRPVASHMFGGCVGILGGTKFISRMPKAPELSAISLVGFGDMLPGNCFNEDAQRCIMNLFVIGLARTFLNKTSRAAVNLTTLNV